MVPGDWGLETVPALSSHWLFSLPSPCLSVFPPLVIVFVLPTLLSLIPCLPLLVSLRHPLSVSASGG